MTVIDQIKRAKLHTLLETSDRQVITDEYITEITEAFASLFLSSSETGFLLCSIGEELTEFSRKLNPPSLLASF